MPLRHRFGLAGLALAALAAQPNQAGAILKDIGRNAGVGAVEKLEPILAHTLADAETRLTRAEDHLGEIGGNWLKGIDHILEQRLLQAKVSTTEVTDHALAGVDELLENRLKQANAVGAKLVSELGKETRSALNTANGMLRDRIGDLGREVKGAVGQANNALAARIEQLDEVAERRLGSVDVIASKQRIALEQTAVHIAVLVGFVVFVVFVLRKLWARYLQLTVDEPTSAEAGRWQRHPDRDRAPAHPDEAAPWRVRGSQRSWMFARGLGGPLIGHLALAVVVAGGILLLYDRLPFAARREAAALSATHEQGLANSMRLLDFTRVRFHASQLEYLKPDNAASYRGLIAKGQLLRDLFERPTLLATDAGVVEVWKRLAEARRLLGPRPDRDLLVIEAMLLWQTGSSRRDEQRAASLCARAMRPGHQPGGFALAPLARVFVELYLAAPYVDPVAGVGRDAEAPADLRLVLDAAPPADETNHPLATKLALIRLMRAVEVASTTAYAETMQAHATLVRLGGVFAKTPAAADARQARNAAARRVTAAWATFDRALRGSVELSRSAEVLAIFRLNDSLYARAKWFVDHPGSNELAPLLAPADDDAGKAPAQRATGAARTVADLQQRIDLAPPRVAWVRRYDGLLKGPAYKLFQVQEAERFAEWERAALAFEQALVAAAASADKTAAAALDAARLGLYTGGDRPGADRVALARVLMPVGGGESLEQALAMRGPQLF